MFRIDILGIYIGVLHLNWSLCINFIDHLVHKHELFTWSMRIISTTSVSPITSPLLLIWFVMAKTHGVFSTFSGPFISTSWKPLMSLWSNGFFTQAIGVLHLDWSLCINFIDHLVHTHELFTRSMIIISTTSVSHITYSLLLIWFVMAKTHGVFSTFSGSFISTSW